MNRHNSHLVKNQAQQLPFKSAPGPSPCKELGWEQLLNRRGTTWRKLPDTVKNAIDEDTAIALMLEQPAMIKRPLLDTGSQRLLGFKAAEYEQVFGQ